MNQRNIIQDEKKTFLSNYIFNSYSPGSILGFKKEKLKEYLIPRFSSPYQYMSNKEVSDLLKESSKKVFQNDENKIFSSRSFRSGFVCQTLLNNLKYNNGNLSNNIKERLRLQLGHQTTQAIDYYYREFITKYISTSNILNENLGENFNHDNNEDNFNYVFQQNILIDNGYLKYQNWVSKSASLTKNSTTLLIKIIIIIIKILILIIIIIIIIKLKIGVLINKIKQ